MKLRSIKYILRICDYFQSFFLSLEPQILSDVHFTGRALSKNTTISYCPAHTLGPGEVTSFHSWGLRAVLTRMLEYCWDMIVCVWKLQSFRFQILQSEIQTYASRAVMHQIIVLIILDTRQGFHSQLSFRVGIRLQS